MSPRFAAKVDGNHSFIVKVLTANGCTVRSLAALGHGAPDLLVGFKGHTYLMEVKDGSKPPSARKLTPGQEYWHKSWKGRPVAVVTNEVEALEALK